MKTIAIAGSTRHGGNTETLIMEALRGAGAPGDTRPFVIEEMNVHGCQGCRGCRTGNSDGCIFEDEMQVLYKEMKEADAIILGSPIYYGEVTGQMKCFMDRWYALRDKDRKLRIAPGKRVLFIIVQGAEGEGRYADAVARIERVLKSYEMVPEMLVAAGLEKKGSAKEHPELLRKAFEAGARLAGQLK